MTRPRLLAVTPLAPWPVRDGHTLRVAYLLDGLAASWDITLVAPAGPSPPWLATVIPVVLPNASTVPWRFDDRPLRGGLDRALAGRGFDRALVFAGAEALWFGRRDLPPAIADLIDCNGLEYWRSARAAGRARERAYWLREIGVATLFARRGFRSFAGTVCVAEQDARWLRRAGGGRQVHVVPNGVSLPSAPPPAVADPMLCLTGSLDYGPNIDAALFAGREVWPLIREAVPTARLLIAGRRPERELLALGALPGVAVMADVADMTSVFARALAALAPMRTGAGIKNKVLEAWACARPAVMTRMAAAGLAPPSAQADLIADDAGGLAERAIALLGDPARAAALGAAAREHVATHFAWARQAQRLSEILHAAES